MEPYTLNRGFLKQDVIDDFFSMIWTERYFGDSEVELVVPMEPELFQKLMPGTFLGVNDSDEIMMLENLSTENGRLKVTGISLMKWLNNRFVRGSTEHYFRHWIAGPMPPGVAIASTIAYMCFEDSAFLNAIFEMGIEQPGVRDRLKIPGLGIKHQDLSGGDVYIAIPYGPLYDVMREIAVTYNLGQKITLEWANESGYFLGYSNYHGLDRTSVQSVNPMVRFSPQLDSFRDIKEVQSIEKLKTDVWVFAPNAPDDLVNPVAGANYSVAPGAGSGFDCRALQVFAEDISSDDVDGDSYALARAMIARADLHRIENGYIQSVDGVVVDTDQYKYGRDYNLGDIVEVQGDSGFLQAAQVMEYIRTHDATGERAYPTLSMLHEINTLLPPMFPPPVEHSSGPVLYSLYYSDATFDTGPYPGQEQDYCHLAYADETGKDQFVDQDPNWDQGYGVWSPDYEKICYIQADRQNVSSGDWPGGGSVDLTPPIPQNPAAFPGSPSQGSVANGATETFDTTEAVIQNVYTTAIPPSGSGSVELYLRASSDLSTGYKLTVTRDGGGTWTVTLVNLNTGATLLTNNPGSFFDFIEVGYVIYDTGNVRFWFRAVDQTFWSWMNLGTIALPLHTGTYVGVVNNTGSSGDWGGGVPDTISKYSLILQNKDGSNKTVLREDAFCYPSVVSYDNSMVAYGECSTGLYDIADYRIVDADGSNDRSIFGPGGYVTSGSGFIQGSWPRLIQWTPDNKIAVWWYKLDTSGAAPYPYLENELRLYEPDGSGDYVVAWDAEAYRVANSIDQYDSETGADTWSPFSNGDVSVNGDYIIGWRGPLIDTGFEDGGNPLKTNDYIGVIIPCEENATPNFIRVANITWADWTLWDIDYSGNIVTNISCLSQPYWSPDGTEVLDHYEYYAPTWAFREWVALAFKPSDLTHRWFAHSPFDPTDPEFTRYGTGDPWLPADSTPPFAKDSYIPTWFRDSLAMTAARVYPPGNDDEDPDIPASGDGFKYIDYKKLDGNINWLAIDTQLEAGWIAPFTGPEYLKGGFASARMLITGLSRPSYYDDQTLS